MGPEIDHPVRERLLRWRQGMGRSRTAVVKRKQILNLGGMIGAFVKADRGEIEWCGPVIKFVGICWYLVSDPLAQLSARANKEGNPFLPRPALCLGSDSRSTDILRRL